MSKRRILVIAVVILVAVVVATWWNFKGAPGDEETAGENMMAVVEAVPGSVSIRVEGPSVIEPYQTRNIRSSIEGVVVMAADSDMERALQQAKINLSKAELNRDRDITNLQKAEKDLADTRQLFASGAVSG